MTEDHGEFITQTQQSRNLGVLHSWFPRWAWNASANFAHIRREFLEEKHTEYALCNHGKKHKGPALIVGAGPSFNRAGPLLKDWNGVIFAPESMAHTIEHYGVHADYIGLYDAHPAAWKLFFEGLDFSKSTLLTHPSVSEEAIEKFPGPRIYYTMMHIPQPDYDVFHPNMSLQEMYTVVKEQQFGTDFFEVIIPTLYPYIATSILNAGCVVNNMIQVAHFMGYSPLVLSGVDFGYPGGMDRCEGWHFKDGEWTVKKTTKLVDIGRELKTSENGILTSEEQIEYKIAMMAVLSIDKPPIIDCSDGIVTELPKANIEDVIKKKARGFRVLDPNAVGRVATDFLMKQDELSKRHREQVAVVEEPIVDLKTSDDKEL